MYDYIIGTITEIETNYITLENSLIGFKVMVSNPYSYNSGDAMKIYLYHHIREDEATFYGFKTKDERSLFLKLISVKGLGCKMALPMIDETATNSIIEAIETDNIMYLKKFPKIGDKVARQIILDLKGKLVNKNETVKSKEFSELIETLEALGYKSPQIKKVLPEIDCNIELGLQVKTALKLMLK